MEPGDLRESPAGSGESDGSDWREVIPGGEEENKPVESNVDTLALTLKDTYEEGQNEKQKCVGDQFHSPYEEELDPRIQVGVRDAHLSEARQERITHVRLKRASGINS